MARASRHQQDSRWLTLRMSSAACRYAFRAAPSRFLLTSALSILLGGSAGATVFALQDAVRAVLKGADGQAAWWSLALPLVPLAALMGIRNLLNNFLIVETAVLASQTENWCTSLLLRGAAEVSLDAFDGHDFPQKIARANVGAESSHTIVQSLVNLLSAAVGVASLGVSVVQFSPWLLAPAVLGALPPIWLNRRHAYSWSNRFDDIGASARLRSHLRSALLERQTAAEVRAFDLGHSFTNRWLSEADTTRSGDAALLRVHTLQRLAVSGLSSIFDVVAILLLLYALHADRFDATELAAAVVAWRMLRSHVGHAQSGASGVLANSLYLRDLVEIERAFKAQSHIVSGRSVPSLKEVTLRDASFRYASSDRAAVDKVNMTIHRGEVVAIVGVNGSGKSTLAKLIANLYTLESGKIEWNGCDYSALDQNSLQACITMTLQDFARWAFSLRENIALDANAPVDARLIMAARLAGLDQLVHSLTDGFETVLSTAIGDGGTELSGGQWQRVALARMFYRGGDLLILDEPSAALDPRAEHQMFANLKRYYRDRAVLYITHRMATVRDADMIHVLDQGRVVESGDHDSLMARHGLYAELFNLQAAAYSSRRQVVR